MGKKLKKAVLAGRAWRLLRLALLWARKGGAVRRGLLPDLRLLPNYVKTLRAARSDMIQFAEREFSFDETPIFHFNVRRPRSMRMPHIPCINPPVEFDDNDDDDDYFVSARDGRASGRLHRSEACEGGEREEGGEGEDAVARGSEELAHEVDEEEEGEEGKCVDMKAEEFIAKFYAQMKLQRQVSLLQYNEMLLRSSS